MGYIDLHLHSNCSDGILSPTQLVQTARRAGLSSVALCDHDTVAGITEAVQATISAGMRLIPGVELSAAFHGYQDLHLLGYGIALNAPELHDRLQDFARRRLHRNRQIVAAVNDRLAAQNRKPLQNNDVETLAGGVLGRPHIARALMACGYVADMQQAFDHYLVPCNIPKHYWQTADALLTIRRAGGVAILAHPTSITHDYQLLTEIITELHGMGLDGVEVYNNVANGAEMLFLQGIARRLNLVVTAGSDFHGIDPEDQIGKGRGGIRFSDALLPPLLELAARRATTAC